MDFCATIGEVAREKIAPRSAEIDERAEYPWDVRRLLAEQDILGLPFPTEYGGTGTGTLMLNMAVEEIAKVDASCALILMVQELGTLPIQLFGSDELKERFLPRCATGEWSPAFALSEPEAGSDPAGMKTTAVQDGDEWVINGTKNWISNLGIADFYVCFAVTDARERRQCGKAINEFQGIQCKLADMETRTAAARELLYKACAMVDRNEPAKGKYSSMAKVFCSDTAMGVTVEAVQVLGG